MKKKVLIIGAGPAGLTAAYELLKHKNFQPIIYEAEDFVGGISRTHRYHGNRMDMGGHRFFSKSKRVTEWWNEILPLQGVASADDALLGREMPLSQDTGAPNPNEIDQVMLVRNRLSRILFLRKFFDYPVQLNFRFMKNIGLVRLFKIGFGYLKARVFPIRSEKSLEDFMINRFGVELYHTFFRDYTEKVWGRPPSQIGADWGEQRIKGLSVTKILSHALKNIFMRKKHHSQQKMETSLIEQFVYPKFGPGQLWESVAYRIQKNGGEIHLNQRISSLELKHGKIQSLTLTDSNGMQEKVFGDFIISTMPIRELIAGMGKEIPESVRTVAKALVYRDFMTVGLLLSKLKIHNETKIPSVNNIIPDLWIYIQEKDVKIGRLQVFNNWSPYLVNDFQNHIWLGLEYFCNEGDELWNQDDETFIDFAISELEKIGVIDRKDVLDSCRIKVPKAYPAYFGSYNRFQEIRGFTDAIPNLFLIGRNGMHRYNNMDHSMLSAMEAVKNIVSGTYDKENIWSINSEKEYHEEKELRKRK